MQRPRFGSGLQALAGAVFLVAAGCTGVIGGGDDGLNKGSGGAAGANGASGSDPTAGVSKSNLQGVPARVRRLSVPELLNTIRDVFTIDPITGITFPTENSNGNFDNQYDNLTYTDDFTLALQAAAEAAGAKVQAKLATLLPCSAQGDAACAGQFIDTFATRAYRRPLTAADRQHLVDLFTATSASEDFPTSIATVTEAIIQSPNFSFRTELGTEIGPKVRITQYELASALSYFILRSAPDQALLDAAKSGALATPDQLVTQAQRLLSDPRAKESVQSVFLEWLEMTNTTAISKSDASFNSGVAASMLAETTAFIGDAVWTQPSGFNTFLTGTTSFVDKNLAGIYGVPTPAGGTMTATSLDATKRAGFLTQPGFIATHQPGLNRSPITLGHFIRSKMFCQTPPPPPPGIPPPPTDATLDVHARYVQHETDPSCSGCHKMMDPIGFGFDQYDVMGRFQPVDHNVTEDGAGELTATDVDGTFHGPVELAKKLTSSAQVKRCFAGAISQYALGRPVTTTGIDGASVQTLLDSDFGQKGDLKALLVSIVGMDSFAIRDTTALPAPAAAGGGN